MNSQTQPPHLQNMLSVIYIIFSGSLSKSCFENWEIFGAKSVEVFGDFSRVDLSRLRVKKYFSQ